MKSVSWWHSGLVLFAALALARPSLADEEQRYVEVSGSGTARTVPDAAAFTAGVESRAERAADALGEVKTTLRSVLDALAGAGVAERDVGTRGFDVRPVYERSKRGETVRLTGYVVSSQLSVRVVDAADLGALLDVAIAAGANQIAQVRFETTDPVAARAAAREQAVADARSKAEQLARLSGVQLGEVLRINENAGGGGGPQPRMAMMAAAAEAVPIAAGTQDFSVTLTVRFALR